MVSDTKGEASHEILGRKGCERRMGYCIPLNSKVPSTNVESFAIVSSISVVSGAEKQNVICLDVYKMHYVSDELVRKYRIVRTGMYYV